jgi:hypothetical protein
MRADFRNPLIIGVIVIILIIAYIVISQAQSKWQEGFETLQDKLQDRTGTLAALTPPLKNPAAAIGISESDGTTLRNLTQAALGVSPRIDNENSYLGLIKFCKEKGVGDAPFSDPAFAENCGMCITSGSLKTGETFTTPTGVLIYGKDKQAAVDEQRLEGAVFPRVLPSLDSAQCVGASMSKNSLPVLAINQRDYDAFRKRAACRAANQIGHECSQCVKNKEFSWIGASADLQNSNIILWGEGTATVRAGGRVVGAPTKLSASAAMFPLGKIAESTTIQLEVAKLPAVNDVPSNDPYVFGILQSTRPNQKIYKLSIDKFLERDSASNSYPRRNPPQNIAEAAMFLPKLVPAAGNDRMVLEGAMPLTFVAADELSAYDCPDAPFVSSQETAELLITDPCLNPRGQGPNNYSEECLRTKILAAGCSTDGTTYKNVDGSRESRTIPDLMTWLAGLVSQSTTDAAASLACRGIDISTPCDAFLNSTATPDQKCMKYLYLNSGEKGRVGRTYDSPQQFNSLNQRTIQFCQPTGTMNPDTEAGYAELTTAAKGYKGYAGLEAVKKYLTDAFTKATGNLDINVDDSEGGRKTSWAKCFGLPLADLDLGSANVKKNSQGRVQEKERSQCVSLTEHHFSSLRRNNYMGKIQSTGNYSINFVIIPKGVVSQWANLFHFSLSGNDLDAGSRSPAMWFWPGTTRLHVRIGDVTDFNWGFDTDPLPIGVAQMINLTCIGNQVTMRAGSKRYKLTQPKARYSGEMKLWISDPWYVPANASVRGFCYKNE